jgi:hypothetical protein
MFEPEATRRGNILAILVATENENATQQKLINHVEHHFVSFPMPISLFSLRCWRVGMRVSTCSDV